MRSAASAACVCAHPCRPSIASPCPLLASFVADGTPTLSTVSPATPVARAAAIASLRLETDAAAAAPNAGAARLLAANRRLLLAFLESRTSAGSSGQKCDQPPAAARCSYAHAGLDRFLSELAGSEGVSAAAAAAAGGSSGQITTGGERAAVWLRGSGGGGLPPAAAALAALGQDTAVLSGGGGGALAAALCGLTRLEHLELESPDLGADFVAGLGAAGRLGRLQTLALGLCPALPPAAVEQVRRRLCLLPPCSAPRRLCQFQSLCVLSSTHPQTNPCYRPPPPCTRSWRSWPACRS